MRLTPGHDSADRLTRIGIGLTLVVFGGVAVATAIAPALDEDARVTAPQAHEAKAELVTAAPARVLAPGESQRNNVHAARPVTVESRPCEEQTWPYISPNCLKRAQTVAQSPTPPAASQADAAPRQTSAPRQTPAPSTTDAAPSAMASAPAAVPPSPGAQPLQETAAERAAATPIKAKPVQAAAATAPASATARAPADAGSVEAETNAGAARPDASKTHAAKTEKKATEVKTTEVAKPDLATEANTEPVKADTAKPAKAEIKSRKQARRDSLAAAVAAVRKLPPEVTGYAEEDDTPFIRRHWRRATRASRVEETAYMVPGPDGDMRIVVIRRGNR